MTPNPAPQTANQPATHGPGSRWLFTSADFDFVAKTILGHAAQGAIDVGLCLRTFDQVADGDSVGWYRAWSATAEWLHSQASASEAAGAASAGPLYLAASEAYDQALAFVDGMPDDSVLLPTFRLHRACWDAFIDSAGGAHLRLDAAYADGAPMPGYLLRPDASGARRPTVVVTNGSDGSLAGLWSYIVKDTLARGWNCYVFDGPGQQSMLFERDIPFRPDWEAVLTPVVDLLAARDDVDEHALLAYGISQGGYWLPRALAFEHRFVAAVVDGGAVDVARAWNAALPAPAKALLDAGDGAGFDALVGAAATHDPAAGRKIAFRSRPYGLTSPFALYRAINDYRLDGLIDRIRTPMLITDPDDDQFFAGQSQELYAALTGPKVLVRYTAEQGAEGHCEPLARQLVGLRITDFFADQLARIGAAR